jgi:hypothetical protein
MAEEKVSSQTAQATTGTELALTPPLRPVKVRTLRDAKRLLSRTITQLQAGTVTGQAAKDLTYLLSVFVQLVRDYELEERIEKLEGKNK